MTKTVSSETCCVCFTDMDPHELHVELLAFETFCLGRCEEETETLQAQQHQQLGSQASDDEFVSAEEDNGDLHAHMTGNRKSQVDKTSSETKAVPGGVSQLLSKSNSKGSKE